jgi:hypothetical protein
MAFLRMINPKRQIKRIDLCPMRKQSMNQNSYKRRASMKLQYALTVAGTAGITMAITLMLLGPKSFNPAYAGPEVKPIIAQPQFQSQGCTFVLKTDKATYEAGQSPVFELTASNPSSNPAQITSWLSMTASGPNSRVSRMAVMPRALWSHEFLISLLPNETKKIAIPCDVMLPDGQDIIVTMTDRKETIRLANPEIRANADLRRMQLQSAQRASVTP